MAAANMPDGDGVVSTVAWNGMDASDKLPVVPVVVTKHPEIEPLTDEVFEHVCEVQSLVSQSVLDHNAKIMAENSGLY